MPDDVKHRQKQIPWYRDEAQRSLIALTLSLLSLIASMAFSAYVFISNQEDKRVTRSAAEVGRIYNPVFVASLSEVLRVYDVYLDQRHPAWTTDLDRMEAFWRSADLDEEMLVVTSRLHAIQNCIESDLCSTEEAYSQFPATIYQVIFYMRDVLFLDGKHSKGIIRDGWWLNPDVQLMLAGYCAWWESNHGEMDLWSEGDEMHRSSDDDLPDPCFKAPST
ncbi:MAG: hypothetical protein AAGC81_01215 [Pseudomonadota bacterium]